LRLHRNGGQSSIRKQAGYMAAPERFADSRIPIAPRAPSIHGPFRQILQRKQMSAFRVITEVAAGCVKRRF